MFPMTMWTKMGYKERSLSHYAVLNKENLDDRAIRERSGSGSVRKVQFWF